MPTKSWKNLPKKLHTYDSWEILFSLFSPYFPKQPRTSFLFYKFSYIILCSKICALLIQTWLTWFFLRTKSHVSQGFGVDYLGLRFNYDCRTLWFATQQQFCKEHFLLDIRNGLLICTLISENQGLEKLSSVSNLRKISGPARLDLFFSSSPGFFSGLWYKSSFFLGGT